MITYSIIKLFLVFPLGGHAFQAQYQQPYPIEIMPEFRLGPIKFVSLYIGSGESRVKRIIRSLASVTIPSFSSLKLIAWSCVLMTDVVISRVSMFATGRFTVSVVILPFILLVVDLLKYCGAEQARYNLFIFEI